MADQQKGRRTAETLPTTRVTIDFMIAIEERHCRTGTICESRSQRFSFPLDLDLDQCANWLKSKDAYILFEDLCVEIGEFLDMDAGARHDR